jgi:hypothetical protein
MKSEFNVELNNNKISDYENLLSRFSNWKKYKREINLNQLLESDKKIEFEVDIPNSQNVFYVNISTDIMDTSGACAVINKLTFIILENNVIDLKVSITVLNTTFGNILRNLLDSNIDLKLYQNTHIEGQIIHFYFELPKQAA